MRSKFAIACLNEVENKDELYEVWHMCQFDPDNKEHTIKKIEYLHKTMCEPQYFDVPDEPFQKCAILEAMFLSGEWKYARDIDQLKKLVDKI